MSQTAVSQTAVSRTAVSRTAVSQTAVSQTSRLKAQRASENGAYVRRLLRQRQPDFAATLAAAEKYVSLR